MEKYGFLYFQKVLRDCKHKILSDPSYKDGNSRFTMIILKTYFFQSLLLNKSDIFIAGKHLGII